MRNRDMATQIMSGVCIDENFGPSLHCKPVFGGRQKAVRPQAQRSNATAAANTGRRQQNIQKWLTVVQKEPTAESTQVAAVPKSATVEPAAKAAEAQPTATAVEFPVEPAAEPKVGDVVKVDRKMSRRDGGQGKVVAIDAAGLCSVKYCIGGLERRIESTALTLVEPAAESDTPAAAE